MSTNTIHTVTHAWSIDLSSSFPSPKGQYHTVTVPTQTSDSGCYHLLKTSTPTTNILYGSHFPFSLYILFLSLRYFWKIKVISMEDYFIFKTQNRDFLLRMKGNCFTIIFCDDTQMFRCLFPFNCI